MTALDLVLLIACVVLPVLYVALLYMRYRTMSLISVALALGVGLAAAVTANALVISLLSVLLIAAVWLVGQVKHYEAARANEAKLNQLLAALVRSTIQGPK